MGDLGIVFFCMEVLVDDFDTSRSGSGAALLKVILSIVIFCMKSNEILFWGLVLASRCLRGLPWHSRDGDG